MLEVDVANCSVVYTVKMNKPKLKGVEDRSRKVFIMLDQLQAVDVHPLAKVEAYSRCFWPEEELVIWHAQSSLWRWLLPWMFFCTIRSIFGFCGHINSMEMGSHEISLTVGFVVVSVLMLPSPHLQLSSCSYESTWRHLESLHRVMGTH